MKKTKHDQRFINFPITILCEYWENPTLFARKAVAYAVGAVAEAKTGMELFNISEYFFGDEDFVPDFLEPNSECDEIDILERCADWFLTFPRNTPMTGFPSDAVEKIDKCSEWDAVVMLAYMAVKSIAGHQRFYKMSNDLLLARMSGYKDVKTLQENGCPTKLRKYNTRHYLEKIRAYLWKYYRVAFYSPGKMRGYYVSLTITPQHLKNVVEKIRQKTILAEYKEAQHELREK